MWRKVGLGLIALTMVLPAASSLAPGAAPAASAVLPDQVPNEIIVSFTTAVPSDVGAWAQAHGATLLMRDDVIHWVSMRLPDAAAADAAMAAAKLRPDVKNAERDGYMHALFTPNDPLYGVQADWPAIHAPQAWDVTKGSHNVKVAVLDTGVYYQHPDLAANVCGPIWSETDEAATYDGFGHGTHVAGTIAAAINNGVGVAGASQSCIMAGKVLDSGGSGQWTWGAAGIRDAADKGADIISMSWGGLRAPSIVGDSVFYAYNTKHVLLVAAAGNNGCNVPLPIFPAIYNDIVAVAALSEDGTSVAGFSNCGPKVEIAAPGVNVLSTMRACPAPICSSSGYGRISGTSMATPHVSGVAALVKAKHADLDNNGLRCVLDLSATDMGLPGKDYQTGWGRVDAANALKEADTLIATLGGAAAVNTACTGTNAADWAGGVPDAPTPVPLPI